MTQPTTPAADRRVYSEVFADEGHEVSAYADGTIQLDLMSGGAADLTIAEALNLVAVLVAAIQAAR